MSVAPPSVSVHSYNTGLKGKGGEEGRGGREVTFLRKTRLAMGEVYKVPESPVVVIAGPVHKVKVRTRGARNGSVPAVSYLSVDVAHVEPLKIKAHLEEVLVVTSERKNK